MPIPNLPALRGRPDRPGLSDGVVTLRPWMPRDAAALVEAWHDPEIVDRLPVPEERDLAAARRWIEGWELRRERGAALDLVITDTAIDVAVGEVGFSKVDSTRKAALIGWWLAEPSRGRGLATRAVGLAADWVFDVGWLDALVAETAADNEPSHRLARRCGFVPLVSPRVDGRIDERADRHGPVYVLRNPQAG